MPNQMDRLERIEFPLWSGTQTCSNAPAITKKIRSKWKKSACFQEISLSQIQSLNASSSHYEPFYDDGCEVVILRHALTISMDGIPQMLTDTLRTFATA